MSISIVKKLFTVANLLKWITISDSLHILVNIAYSQRYVAQALARMEIQSIIAMVRVFMQEYSSRLLPKNALTIGATNKRAPLRASSVPITFVHL